MIESIKIEGFRGIESGEVGNLSPLTILVGPNGCGKSTVLESILLAVSTNTIDAIRNVVGHRGSDSHLRWLFRRQDSHHPASAQVAGTQIGLRSVHLTLTRVDEDGVFAQFRGEGKEAASRGEANYSFKGDVSFSKGKPPDGAHSGSYGRGSLDAILVDPYSPSRYLPLHRLFGKAVEQGRKAEVVSLIKSVMSEVEVIEILVEQDAPVVHLVFPRGSIPIALSGDGVAALFRLALELGQRPGSIVLLEEPEVHQHPRALYQTASAVLAAVRRQVQVVLTTHSLELIDAILANCEEEDLGRMSVHRLALRDGTLLASRLDGPQVSFERTQIQDDLR